MKPFDRLEHTLCDAFGPPSQPRHLHFDPRRNHFDDLGAGLHGNTAAGESPQVSGQGRSKGGTADVADDVAGLHEVAHLARRAEQAAVRGIHEAFTAVAAHALGFPDVRLGRTLPEDVPEAVPPGAFDDHIHRRAGYKAGADADGQGGDSPLRLGGRALAHAGIHQNARPPCCQDGIEVHRQ
ncbi:MAG: hypothetical protein DI596_05420 [Azospira oryzae]|nr:MAG: hypothetical protein DI596_05420 [Azospira oryzae]PZP80885.1 MAG: hypothetical protein DI593_05420 [Azospira oryzae]